MKPFLESLSASFLSKRVAPLAAAASILGGCAAPTPKAPVIPLEEGKEYSITIPLERCKDMPTLFSCAKKIRDTEEKGEKNEGKGGKNEEEQVFSEIPYTVRKAMLGALLQSGGVQCSVDSKERQEEEDILKTFGKTVQRGGKITIQFRANEATDQEAVRMLEKEQGIRPRTFGPVQIDATTGIVQSPDEAPASQTTPIRVLTTGCKIKVPRIEIEDHRPLSRENQPIT